MAPAARPAQPVSCGCCRRRAETGRCIKAVRLLECSKWNAIHNKTNARFVSGVSSQTDYLISSRKDTRKAQRAKSFGTKVIDESEMIAFIKAGNFPVKRV